MLPAGAVAERLVRQESGKVLAGLIRWVGDFDLAEDCLQDALAAALQRWPLDGVPDNPAAWLTTTARRKGVDRLRRSATAGQHADALRVLAELEQGEGSVLIAPFDIPDERLRLIFTCCHPALPQEARVALTLRTLGGLSTSEIAGAFLVPEATMAQRIVRAKKKIRLASIPYQVPNGAQIQERLDSVLSVVYLIFNEGYFPSASPVAVRTDLCEEALRLGQTLRRLLPEQPEVLGVVALMLLLHARKAARDRVLEEQDRSLWDQKAMENGRALVKRALTLGSVGPYQLQAAIAAVHSEATTFEATDWKQIAGLYAVLAHLCPSSVVELNRAVVASMLDGPGVGLGMLEPLAPDLRDYQPFQAARADLLRRAGRLDEAVVAYRRALAAAPNPVAREFLRRRLLASSEGER